MLHVKLPRVANATPEDVMFFENQV